MRTLRTLTLPGVVALAWLAFAQTASAAPRGGGPRGDERFGVGLMVGDPIGPTLKYFFSDLMAFDFTFGYGSFGDDHLELQLDLLWHLRMKDWPKASLDLYLGFGPKLGFFYDDRCCRNGRDGPDDEVGFGIRFVTGVSAFLAQLPFELFFEIAPAIWFVEFVGPDLDVATGFRYYF